MADMSDLELLDALGVEAKPEKKKDLTPREERIIAGFEDIEQFVEESGHAPQHGEEKDIFERLYAVRLDKIRGSAECRTVLNGLGKYGLLTGEPVVQEALGEGLDDEALLSKLGVKGGGTDDITNLTHVRPRSEIRVAEEIAQRQPCKGFDQFKALFSNVRKDLDDGIRKTIEFKDNAQINLGDFFILSGQLTYVAEVGAEFRAPNGDLDARLRVIYDNGAESNLLRRSLQRALYKDDAGRRITDSNPVGPLFSGQAEDSDNESGIIYVLRSKSEHPLIKEHRSVVHKIGVTSGDINRRIANAKNDPTFLMDDVEVIATYKLSNINRTKLENLIHKFFEPAKLGIKIQDRFGKSIVPREWFLVPIKVIDEAIAKIKDGSIIQHQYDSQQGKIVRR